MSAAIKQKEVWFWPENKTSKEYMYLYLYIYRLSQHTGEPYSPAGNTKEEHN